MAITWLMEWRIFSSCSFSLVLGRTTGAEDMTAALLTSFGRGPPSYGPWFRTRSWMQMKPLRQDASALMESLLTSLLDDFDHWFHRGEQLLQDCPTTVGGEDDQLAFRERLWEGLRAVAATRALMKASSQPMAVSMEAMTPWHGLVTEVWGLAARIGRATH